MSSGNGGIDEKELEQADLSKIQSAMRQVNYAAGKQAEEDLRKIFSATLQKGIMPKAALQINDNTMEAIYSQGYNLYNQGKYTEASYIFRLLSLLDYMEPKYMLGLAASQHRMKQFQEAILSYFLCSALDANNPMPHYHAADCYLQMDSKEMAIFSLQMAINACGEQPQYQTLKERALLLQNGLKEQLTTEDIEKKEDAPTA